MGRWTPIGGRLFWVPQEPWGWVPYHLGLWHWDTGAGWMWLPGSRFAPAWVTWTNCEDQVVWQPFGLWDWWGWPSRPPGNALLEGPFRYAYTEWGLGRCGLPYFGDRRAQTQWVTNSVTEGAPLAPSPVPQPTPSPEPEDERPRPPREIRKLSESFTKRLQQGDPEALESVRKVAGSVGVLPRRETRAAAEDQMRVADGTERPDVRVAPPFGHRAFAGPAVTAPANEPAAVGRGEAGRVVARPADARFRDWNPDVRAARDLGGRIRYDSERNVVRCEDCRRPLTRPSWPSGLPESGSSASSGSGDAGAGSSAGAAGGPAGGSAAGGNRDAGGSQDRTKQH